jgi:hypothetical protein
MTRPHAHILIPALFAPALFLAAPAAAEPAERAVSVCRAELLNHFPQGSVRNYRVTDISGNSRTTRVTISVNADRRYTFRCAAGADGRIATATFNPPRADGPQVATGQQ